MIDLSFFPDDVVQVFKTVEQEFTDYSIERIVQLYQNTSRDGCDSEEQLATIVKCCCELTKMEQPRYAEIAGRFSHLAFTRKLRAARKTLTETEDVRFNTFYDTLVYLTGEKLYCPDVLETYTKEEVLQCYSFIKPEYDKLLDYAALDLLVNRYVICSHDHQPLETIQEMFLGIAMFLAMGEEKAQRLKYVEEFYNVLASLKMTVATPTLGNARKPYHQLSSCFIDTVPDSLDGIYRSIDSFARISKLGGGMGLYMGKIRGRGGSIRGFTNAAGGVIPWVKVVNNTAVAVDQLGVRQGACAVYLDVWHYDLLSFTQIRTNNGDDRMKAHDVFPALCVPDLFWKLASESLDNQWHLLCPQSVQEHLGIKLEDKWGEEWEKAYQLAIKHPKIRKQVVTIRDVVKLLIKSLVETGTPFIFNRDTVNRANPNKHKGMIYSSNLCTEIAQNMSESKELVYEASGDNIVTNAVEAGDFVVCNLASLVLPRILHHDTDEANKEELAHVTNIAVRMLDNVIDRNLYPVPYAKYTNSAYRALGLGVSGYHHWLAINGIKWESEEHLEFVDKWFEEINYCAIDASSKLAEERGSYKYWKGSDWDTGEYYTTRGYTSTRWKELAERTHTKGMRNGYLLAVAPTSSTSIVANTTAGIDPIMKKYFLEEKKSGLLPRVAPDLNAKTMWLYKNAHTIDQNWSIRACGVRQRHIDQGQSMNIYITNDTTMRTVLQYYIDAWKRGVKTVYYVRSTALEVEACESCAS